MSRVNLPINEIVRDGLQATAIPGDYSLGHVFDNNGRIFLEIANNNGTTNQDVTFLSTLDADGLEVADLVVTITDGDMVKHGPFKTQTFNQAGDVVHIDIDSTGLEFTAYKLATS